MATITRRIEVPEGPIETLRSSKWNREVAVACGVASPPGAGRTAGGREAGRWCSRTHVWSIVTERAPPGGATACRQAAGPLRTETEPDVERMISFGPPPFSFPSPEIEPGRRVTTTSGNCDEMASASISAPETRTSMSAR